MPEAPLGKQWLAAFRRLTSYGAGGFRSLADLVIPVLVVGEDESDDERATWCVQASATAAAAQFPAVGIGPGTAPREARLLLALLSSTGSQQIIAFTDDILPAPGTWANVSNLLTTTRVNFAPQPGRLSLAAVGRSAVGTAAQASGNERGFSIVANGTLIMPVNRVLPASRSLLFQGATAATTLRGSFFFQEL